jgi:DNA-binding beta-propeller fold protein YncE
VQRWYITFHGGDGPHTWNNIHSFSLEGQPMGKVLDTHSLPDELELRELRGFGFGPDGDLYVTNAYKDESQVLRFAGQVDANGQHPFREVYVERHATNPGLHHPFDVAFGPDRNLYVPSQDTNLVGRYFGPQEGGGAPGAPMPHPEALREADIKDPLPGTFVPSQEHVPSGVRTVRRAIFGVDGDLYVADRDADSIKRYHGESGGLQREYRHHHLKTPVHLVFRAADGALLVGSRDRHEILAIDPVTGDTTTLVEPRAGGLKAPAGMAFGPDGKLYVSSRETKQILRYDAMTGEPDSAPFIDELEDFPEFIAIVGT